MEKENKRMNKLAFKARIFQKKQYNIWDDRNRINQIIGFCILIIIGLMFFDNDKFNNRITGAILIILLVCRIALMVAKFGVEKKSNEEGGFLEISENELRFKEKEIKVKDIVSLSIELDNYYEQIEYRSPNSMRPIYTQGFDNILEFTTKKNQNYKVRFQLKNKEHKNKLIPFLYHLIINKVITPEKGAKILNLKRSEKESYFKNLEKFKNK